MDSGAGSRFVRISGNRAPKIIHFVKGNSCSQQEFLFIFTANREVNLYTLQKMKNGGEGDMTQTMSENEKNSMLMKGIVIGGLIGGVFSLIDAKTRNQLKETAVDLTSTSKKMLSGVKENPGEMKEQMVSQFTQVTNVLKEVITDAQKLYERLNEDLFSKMGDFKEVSSDALSTVKDAKDDLKQIGSKIVDAGSELKGIATLPGEGNSTSSEQESSSSSEDGTNSGGSETNATGGEAGTSSFSGMSEGSSSENGKLKTEAAGNSNEKIESFGNESSLGISDQSGFAGTSSSEGTSSTGSKDKSAGLQYDNKNGEHTYGGQETPNQKK